MFLDLFIHIQLCFLRLVILMFRYINIFVGLIAIGSIIINIFILISSVSGGEMELSVIFI